MSDREALQAVIRANPNDDLPRLIYADWLEEHADSLPDGDRETAGDRAAFIRAQIQAARAEPFSPEARRAGELAGRLLTTMNREAWTDTVRDLILDCTFERGFIEHAVVDAPNFPDHAATLLELEPIRSLRAARRYPRQSDREGLLDSFFETPGLARIESLDLQNLELCFAECEKLTESPYLAGLDHLGLGSNPIFPDWLQRFLESDRLPNLTSLDLANITHLGPAMARAFRAADHRRFTRLDCSGIAIRSEDLKRSLLADCVSEVERLCLCWDGAVPGPLTHLELGWVIPWRRLRFLDLRGQQLGPAGIREIAQLEDAAELRWLGLSRNSLGSRGVEELVEASNLKLYHLDARENDLGIKDVSALRERFPDARIVV